MTAHAVPNQPPGWSPMPGQPPLAPAAASPSSKNTKWLIPAAIGAVLVVVIGIVAAIALSGESDQPSAAETSTATAMPSASGAKPPEQTAIPPAGGAAAPGQPVVLIDGQNQDVTGDVTCVTYQGETYLTIQGAANISVGMRVGSPPVVTLIGMDRVGGLSLGYTEGGEGSVQATKDGSTYTVSGTITGADSDNPTGKLTKSVEITVVCP